ncbi:Aminoglycoside 3N-acetyltransferase [Acanthamoeba castellanii str. Neff]|uniref:Aminoglycoside 3N-acetyltransferase n=1 Tax=Acanthamoeba castellanii (strain ATCC 30010 / Neff) TaxID=1257118 RepID=L8GG89_ACACF|nr:Aminoglycoside 3N-acetyltransferase [Acanthamoeba castellanii str. Neff]ELR11196.1 Aminoglycoside 3N-acetyltransferase [Acanthamoeba castellanii str. Neff]
MEKAASNFGDSEGRVMAATPAPRCRSSVAANLRALGLCEGDAVVVHSSMSSIGWALMDVVGPEGTIMMPSFTYVYSDPANWSAPPAPRDWHDTIRREMPLFNPLFTPTFGMGRIAECFRSWPGTHRSGHPQASLTAWGKHARYLTEDHALDYPFDSTTSPLGKMSALPGSKVLLLGVSWNRNSSFYVAEKLSGCFQPTKEGCPWLDADGNKIWQEFDDVDSAEDELLEEVGAAFEESTLRESASLTSKIQRGKVGSASCRLFGCKASVDFAVLYYQQKKYSK